MSSALQRATAEDWYAAVVLPDGVTHLYEKYIDPFYRCNIWHVRGSERSVLFDSGLGAVSLVGQFPWLKFGKLLAVASHTHFDHIGNHHEFPDRACHRCEADILAAPTRDGTLATRYAKLSMFERLPPDGFDADAYQVQAAPATRILEQGDTLDLGDRRLNVIHVPGHSPGSIALWEEATGLLLSGDAVYDGPLIDDAYHSNAEDYVATLSRLRLLQAH